MPSEAGRGDRTPEAAMAEVEARLAEPPAARPHGLSVPLVVSLTSYPARFPTLHLTLASLLAQTVRPDAVVLWLGTGQAAALPEAVTALRPLGLEVRETRDLRSYTKIVPALLAHPEAAVVTADDDIHYPADALEELVEGALARPGDAIARRAHRIGVGEDGGLLPYAEWMKGLPLPERGPLVFPTGNAGVLHPAGSLPPEALRAEVFLELAPTADDLWLWWMHRLAGGVAGKVGEGRRPPVLWPGTQGTALYPDNIGSGGNDRAAAALAARYGLPLGGA